MKIQGIYPYILFLLGIALTLSLCGCSAMSPTVVLPTASTPVTAAIALPTATSIPPTEAATIVPASPLPVLETALPYEQLVTLFDYNPISPFTVQEKGVQSMDGAQVHDISFQDSKGIQEQAFLVTPSGKGPYAGIEFLGGSGRYQFLNEAVGYAKMGVVSLLLESSPMLTKTSVEADRDQVIKTIIDLRKGLDLLLSQPGVDPARIAFVGHSDGAIFGGVLAGVDKRVKAYILMSGTAHYSKELVGNVSFPDPTQEAAYLKGISQMDGINFIGHAAPAALLFQNGLKDELVPVSDASEFQQAGSEPKTIKMYDADHGLNEEANQDRIAWLQVRLGLSSQQ